MAWICLMRIRYIWIFNKTGNKESNITFRNQEGDWSILFFVLLLINKSRFDHYKFAFQPILRYFYMIIVGLFVVYFILQLTQYMMLTTDALIAQEVTIKKNDLTAYAVKKWFYGYKFTVTYMKNEKEKKVSFFTTKNNKEVIEKRFKEYNVNIV